MMMGTKKRSSLSRSLRSSWGSIEGIVVPTYEAEGSSALIGVVHFSIEFVLERMSLDLVSCSMIAYF